MLLKRILRNYVMLLIILVTTNLKSFSQTDTTSTIQLSKPVAKLVIKDLITGDELQKQLDITNQILKETNSKFKISEDIIANLKTQNNNFSLMINDYEEKSNTQAKLSEDLQKALKRQKRQTTIYKIAAGIGTAATVLLLIQ